MCSDPQAPSVQLACDMMNASRGLCAASDTLPSSPYSSFHHLSIKHLHSKNLSNNLRTELGVMKPVLNPKPSLVWEKDAEIC